MKDKRQSERVRNQTYRGGKRGGEKEGRNRGERESRDRMREREER